MWEHPASSSPRSEVLAYSEVVHGRVTHTWWNIGLAHIIRNCAQLSTHQGLVARPFELGTIGRWINSLREQCAGIGSVSRQAWHVLGSWSPQATFVQGTSCHAARHTHSELVYGTSSIFSFFLNSIQTFYTRDRSLTNHRSPLPYR